MINRQLIQALHRNEKIKRELIETREMYKTPEKYPNLAMPGSKEESISWINKIIQYRQNKVDLFKRLLK